MLLNVAATVCHNGACRSQTPSMKDDALQELCRLQANKNQQTQREKAKKGDPFSVVIILVNIIDVILILMPMCWKCCRKNVVVLM